MEEKDQPSREFVPVFESVVGVDVHSKVNVACYYEPKDANNYYTEFKEFNTMRDGILELVEWVLQKKASAVIMESTGVYWKTLYRELARAGLKVVVVNPRHAKNLPGRKTDMADSMWLARLGCYGLLAPSFVPPPNIDIVRQKSRLLQKVTQDLTRAKNRVVKMLVDYGLRLDTIVSDIFGKSARDIIEAIANGMPPEEAAQLVSTRLKATPDDIRRALAAELDDDQRCLLRRLLKQVDWFEGQKDDLEFELEAAFAEHSELLDRLETIPGVNRVTAAAVLAEIGTDMSVFGNSERLCKWAGVCPGNNESAGKRKSGKTVAGNKWLRRTLCESAHAATKTTSHFCGVFKRIKARRGFKRAIVAIAHRLLRTVFVLISRKDVYRDRTIDYETLGLMLRLPRWAKVLKQLGYLVRPPKPQASEKPSSA